MLKKLSRWRLLNLLEMSEIVKCFIRKLNPMLLLWKTVMEVWERIAELFNGHGKGNILKIESNSTRAIIWLFKRFRVNLKWSQLWNGFPNLTLSTRLVLDLGVFHFVVIASCGSKNVFSTKVSSTYDQLDGNSLVLNGDIFM